MKNSEFDEEFRVRQGKTKGVMPSNSSKGELKQEDSNSSQRRFLLMETWGQGHPKLLFQDQLYSANLHFKAHI